MSAASSTPAAAATTRSRMTFASGSAMKSTPWGPGSKLVQRAFFGSRRSGRRRDPAGLHPPPARPTGSRRSLLAGLLRKARARPRTAGRLPGPREPNVARHGRAGRHQHSDRSPHGGRRARIRRHPRQQPRRVERSRFRHRIRLLPGDDRHPPQRLGRRMDPVDHHRVRLHSPAARVLHRLVDHAAKDQSRRAGADPRPHRRASSAT